MFRECKNLSSFCFECGSRITSLGSGIFTNAKLKEDSVEYPSTLKKNKLEHVTVSMINSYKKGYEDGYD